MMDEECLCDVSTQLLLIFDCNATRAKNTYEDLKRRSLSMHDSDIAKQVELLYICIFFHQVFYCI